MIKRLVIPACIVVVAAGTLFADFSYDQTTKITGGAMAGAMKVVGVLSRQAAQPVKTTTLLKGDRMATVSADSLQVIDLSRETVTEINLKNRTYSVVTFAQMAQAMEAAFKKASADSGTKTDVNFKASVQETGQTKTISGLDTREVILKMVLEATDKDSGNKGAMNMVSNIWLARSVPGYGELRDFQQRMAAKLAWMPGSSAFAQGRGDMAKAFSDLAKESAKLDGVPVLQIVSMGGSAEGQAGQQQAQPRQQEEQSAPSIGGALGRLGGLGGLGRRKQTEEPKQGQQTASSGAPGTLMELTTESSNFSSASVDASKFEVPAGFKQVESEMLRSMNR
jgi:hypothetical protein